MGIGCEATLDGAFLNKGLKPPFFWSLVSDPGGVRTITLHPGMAAFRQESLGHHKPLVAGSPPENHLYLHQHFKNREPFKIIKTHLLLQKMTFLLLHMLSTVPAYLPLNV